MILEKDSKFVKSKYYMMMPKNHQLATQSLHARNNTFITKRKNLTKNTSVVPAKYSSKVKLEYFRNSKVLDLESIMRTCFLRIFGFL